VTGIGLGQPLASMRILVTGGTGYLGRELVARGAVGVSRSTGVDVRDEEAVCRALAGFDAVIHTAYVQDGPDAWSTNVEGSRAVARAARGVRLIHLSTDVVFGGGKGSPYVEDDAPDPVTEYGRSKAAAEAEVAREHPEALIVRTSLIYGGAEPSKHELAARDPAKTFYTDEVRCPVQVGELAERLLELVATDFAGPLHLAGADAVSRHEFASLIVGREARGAEAPTDRPKNCALGSTRVEPLRGVREVLATSPGKRRG
jgi:dTDP-4-dehydrorhamnose reductase